jgi:phospholipid-transporting ATPase
LYLIGATAVEDKLQPMVPETIADFLRANIKVWMLTGDKLETAENIAKSCRLIQGDMAVMRIAETTLDGMVRKLSDNKETFDLCVK